MSLQEKLKDDLKDCLRKRDTVGCSTIRLALAGAMNAEIAKGAPLDDTDMIRVISKEVSKHKESIDAFRKGNRPELVAKEEAELAILMSYMPQQMSHAEIEAAALQVIAEVGAKGSADKGKVMQKLAPMLKGKADGREVNVVATELLSKM